MKVCRDHWQWVYYALRTFILRAIWVNYRLIKDNILLWLSLKYGSCMIDDLLFDMLDDYNFEMFYDYSFGMIFWNYYHSLKKDCADRPFEITYFSISGQHNLWKQFLMLLGLICYMTIVCKWGGKIFVHKIIFVRRNLDILLTKIPYNLYFSYTAFYAGLGPYPCV